MAKNFKKTAIKTEKKEKKFKKVIHMSLSGLTRQSLPYLKEDSKNCTGN